MDKATWQRAKWIFDEARGLTDEARSEFVKNACANDAELRAEVEKLLASYDSEFLEETALGPADALIEPQFTTGQTIGRYRIKELIGTGGMGQVFLADDTELDRKVAFKVIHREVAADAERVRRFIQEARAASALNHPNILTIHEIGSFDDARFIVSEYIDGETLRERMRRGLNAAESVEIACQMAAALDAAHSAGIVHRDIKPENVMIRRDGLVKVLDFGLAKLTAADDRPIDAAALASSPLETSPGLVMGTVAYMSPEQARGQAVDARTDIWSLGVVLHEMLTGRSPFEGESVTELITSILKTDGTPPTTESLPPDLRPICQKALSSKKESRYRSAHDLLNDLKGEKKRMEYAIQPTPFVSAVSTDDLKTQLIRPRPTLSAEYVVNTVKRHKYATSIVAAVAITIGVGLSVYKFQGATPGSSENLAIIDEFTKETDLKFDRLPISGQTSDVAISPDGKYAAYIENPSRGIKLMQIDNSATSTIVAQPATGFVWSPSFTPDGKYLYYYQWASVSESKLLRVLATGGTPQEIAQSPSAGAAFTPDGSTLVFTRDSSGAGGAALEMVRAKLDGSDISTIAKTSTGESIADRPTISPDGKTAACQVRVKEGNGWYVKILGFDMVTGQPRPLTDNEWGNTFGLVWLSNGNLLILGYKRSALTSTNPQNPQIWLVTPDGRSKPVTSGPTGYFRLSATSSGSVILTQQVRNSNDLWMLPDNDQAKARQVTTSGELAGGFAATPDGRIVMGSRVTGTLNLWLLSADGSERKPLTSEGSLNAGPVVTPDGKYIVFNSTRVDALPRIFRMDINGENVKQLTNGPGIRPRMSGDGKWAYYFEGGQPDFEMFDVIKKVPINGGESLTVATPPNGWKFHSFDVNPVDGRIAVGLLRREVNQFVYKAGIIAKEGGAVTKMLDLPANLNTGTLRWMPDNRNIATLGKDDPGPGQMVDVWKVPLSKTGKPTRLTNFRTPVTNNFNWSLDGKFMLVGHTKQMSEPVIIRISAQ